jgi:hypothetical protein
MGIHMAKSHLGEVAVRSLISICCPLSSAIATASPRARQRERARSPGEPDLISSRRLAWSVAAALAIVPVTAGPAQAHHRTGTEPTGFTATHGASIAVTPACGVAAVSCRYFDGRRSLRVTTNASTASGTVITRRPEISAGQTYKLFARLRADTPGTVRLRPNWYNAANALVSTGESTTITATTNWLEWRLTATAPAGAVRVEAGVVAPAQPSFTFHADTFQLNHCNPNCRIDT